MRRAVSEAVSEAVEPVREVEEGSEAEEPVREVEEVVEATP